MMYLSSYLRHNATNAAFSPLLRVCYSAVACLATVTFTLAHLSEDKEQDQRGHSKPIKSTVTLPGM